MSDNQSLRIIVIQEEGGMFAAQCLEYDICTQADSIETLKDRLCRQIEIERMVSRDYTGEEFGGIAPAPEFFHSLWEHATELDDSDSLNYRLAEAA